MLWSLDAKLIVQLNNQLQAQMRAVEAMDCDANFHTWSFKIVQDLQFKHERDLQTMLLLWNFYSFPFSLKWQVKNQFFWLTSLCGWISAEGSYCDSHTLSKDICSSSFSFYVFLCITIDFNGAAPSLPCMSGIYFILFFAFA